MLGSVHFCLTHSLELPVSQIIKWFKIIYRSSALSCDFIQGIHNLLTKEGFQGWYLSFPHCKSVSLFWHLKNTPIENVMSENVLQGFVCASIKLILLY